MASLQPDAAYSAPDGSAGGSLGGGTVLLEQGASLQYDWLARAARFAQQCGLLRLCVEVALLCAAQVLALGAEAAAPSLPGLKECAVPFATLEARRVAPPRQPRCAALLLP